MVKNRLKQRRIVSKKPIGLRHALFFIVVVCLVVFSSSLVSAFDWDTISAELTTFDNKLTYADNDLTVTIDNLFGIGAEIGKVTLKSHKTFDEVLKFEFWTRRSCNVL